MRGDIHLQPGARQLSRRELLLQSGLGCGALGLSALLARDADGATTKQSDRLRPTSAHLPPRARHVIWLFMHGGPSQVDTFDPKPTLARYDGQAAPREFHSIDLQFTEVAKQQLMASRMQFRQCGESGIEICNAFHHLQACADKLAVIRSVHHDTFNHTPGIYLMNTGHNRLDNRPSMGSWLCYGLGSEADNLPAYVVLTSRGLKPGPGVWSHGFLPALYQGTKINTSGPALANVQPPKEMSMPRQRQVLDYTRALNRRHLESRADDSNLDARIASYELAFRMQMAAPEAMDVSRETRATHQLYGPGFGQQCLIARRLVERGVRVVQIYDVGGARDWDTHDDTHARHVDLIRGVDRGCAALLHDLTARGLLDDTLVIWSGEFGRSPTTENRREGSAADGRDHSPYGFSMWMAGGGVAGGQVIGATDELGFRAVSDKLHVHDLHATILKLMGLDHERLTFFHQGRQQRLTDVAGYHDIAARLTTRG